MHFFKVDPNSNPVIKGYCRQCGVENSLFNIFGFSQILNPENTCRSDHITHQASGFCVGCGQSALFYLNMMSGARSRPAFESEVKRVTGNLLLATDVKVRLRWQLPKPPEQIVPEYLPPNVERAFKDAENSYVAGHWNQAAGGYRKAVDRAITPFVSGHDSIKRKSRPMLGDKLAALEQVGDLPKSMIEWIRIVKNDGNYAMHDEHRDLESREDVRPARLFAKTLLEYLYTLPETVSKTKGEIPHE